MVADVALPSSTPDLGVLLVEALRPLPPVPVGRGLHHLGSLLWSTFLLTTLLLLIRLLRTALLRTVHVC